MGEDPGVMCAVLAGNRCCIIGCSLASRGFVEASDNIHTGSTVGGLETCGITSFKKPPNGDFVRNPDTGAPTKVEIWPGRQARGTPGSSEEASSRRMSFLPKFCNLRQKFVLSLLV